jgi:hypothetical protein
MSVSGVRRAKGAHAITVIGRRHSIISSARIAGDEKVNIGASIQEHIGRPAIFIRIS